MSCARDFFANLTGICTGNEEREKLTSDYHSECLFSSIYILSTHQVLVYMVVVVNKSVPVPQMGVKATIGRRELFLVETKVPLADNSGRVAQVFEVLWQQFAWW
jgi:hypothetical protein